MFLTKIVRNFFFYREVDVKGISAYSKCKMYNVNLTTIQSWDYENWNATERKEKLGVVGKYCECDNNKDSSKSSKTRSEKNGKIKYNRHCVLTVFCWSVSVYECAFYNFINKNKKSIIPNEYENRIFFLSLIVSYNPTVIYVVELIH